MNIQTGLTLRHSFSVRIVSAVLGGALALMMSSSVFAENAAAEVKAAAVHAGLAASAGDVKGVQTHLHHALNCLVGPDGDGFDANEMNPCQGMGSGAIPGTMDDAQKAHLQDVVDTVQGGLDTGDYEEAKEAAMNAAEMLKAQQM